jgi:hypothetical protein
MLAYFHDKPFYEDSSVLWQFVGMQASGIQ